MLVHASVVPEPFGQVVAQGLAAGVPVVAADTGGPAEMIEDGVNGFLVSAGEVISLADVLVRLAREPQIRIEVGARGRETAARFQPEVVATEVQAVYSEVLGAFAGGSRSAPLIGRRAARS